jgi:hypothetical protein
MKIVNVHIAKSPCYPPYGVIVEYDDGQELWDCDCASNLEEVTIEAAREEYPEHELLMWDHPLHYSNRKDAGACPLKW